MSPLKLSKILVPTDFSGHAEKAFRYACDCARLFDADLFLLHVFDTRVVDNIYHIHQLTPEAARREMRISAERSVERFRALEEAAGIRITPLFEEGIPQIEVKRVAAEIGADLIVMGTHGTTGLTQLLYGTTAEGVVRGAPCPVLTINP